MKKTLIILLSIILISAGLGCAALSTYVTPADIDKKAVVYAVDAGVADAADYTGYPNLAKADKLQQDVDAAHSVNQFDLEKLMQKDTLDYSIHKDVVATNYKTAVYREDALFGQEGLLTLGLSMCGAGGLAGFIGLMRKRPGDITQIEAEHAVAEATGKTTEELSTKQKQFIQLVKGVQKFLDGPGAADTGVEVALKNAMNETQDTDTRVAVAAVKSGGLV